MYAARIQARDTPLVSAPRRAVICGMGWPKEGQEMQLGRNKGKEGV